MNVGTLIKELNTLAKQLEVVELLNPDTKIEIEVADGEYGVVGWKLVYDDGWFIKCDTRC